MATQIQHIIICQIFSEYNKVNTRGSYSLTSSETPHGKVCMRCHEEKYFI